MATSQLARVIQELRGISLQQSGDGTDGHLLELFIAQRDEAAFEALVRLHGPMVLGVCRRILRNEHDAADAFQATFLVLARKASSVCPRERVGNWLYGVACRTARETRRAECKRRLKEQQACELARSTSANHAWEEYLPVLDEELSRLPERYRTALVLCDLEGKTRKEAAAQLGLPPGTVASRQARGRTLLAKRLTRRGFVLSGGTLAALMSPEVVAASLVVVTVKAATSFAVGRATAAGVIANPVAAVAEGVLKAMFLVKLRWMVVVWLLGAVLCAGAVVSAHILNAPAIGAELPDDATPGEKKPLPRQEALERFDRLKPADRLQLVEKLVDKEFQPAVRGDVVVTIAARGSVEFGKYHDIYCPDIVGAAAINTIVANGTQVKKGDTLIVLDDRLWQGELKEQRERADLAFDLKVKAEKDLKVAQLTGQVEVRSREIDHRLAELDLKKYAGKDAEEKELLQLKVERARLYVEQARAIADARETQLHADLRTKTATVKRAKTAVAEIEQKLKEYRLLAPQDGTVVYYVPVPKRDGSQKIVAQGEWVGAGQKLLQMPDLTKMLVEIRVPETLVFHLRDEEVDKNAWQLVQIQVDAFPNRTLKGHIQRIYLGASQPDFFASGVKMFKTLIAIDEPLNGLIPGLSAGVQIEAARATAVVQVPVQSMVRIGKADYCYVKVGSTIQKRRVGTGFRNDRVVEITAGLQESEAVMLNPPDLLQRLSSSLQKAP